MKQRERLAALARVSSREQEQEGYSLEVQVAAFEKFAENSGSELVHVIKCPESAKESAKRAAFGELLAYARNPRNRVDKLVFHKVDRAVRSLQDLAKLEELRSDCGIETVFLDLGIDTSTAVGEFMVTSLAGIARLQIRQSAEKILASTEQRVLVAGLFPGRAPYGYKNVRTSKKRSLIEVHPEHGPKVPLIFRMLADNPITVPQLRQRLFEEGIFYTAKCPKFPLSKLYKLFHDRAYIQEVKYRGEWHACGAFPALVDRDLFERVQDRLGKKQNPNGHDLLFAGGLIQCKHCGSAITGEVQKQRYVYYHCTKISRQNGHPRVRLRQEVLEEQVLGILDGLQTEAGEVREWFLEVLRARAQEGQDRGRGRRSRLQGELTKVQAMKDRLLDLLLQEKLAEDAYRRKESELRDREWELTQQLQNEAQAQTEGNETAVKVLELSQALRERWVMADQDTKRLLLDLLCSNFTLDGETLVPELRMPFSLLSEGLLVGGEGIGGGGGSRTPVPESAS